ncbi:MAG: D-amino-acid transaminase [Alphaproteobacteria bacterium]
MSRIAYVNGRYVKQADAAVHIEDRGYQFADGVYEVIAVAGGRLIDEAPHMERLARSLSELQIAMPMTPAALAVVLRETARRNGVHRGIVYLQITRGVSRRDHPFPNRPIRPAVVATARRTAPADPARIEAGVAVITLPDIRWARCDIKSVLLLPNVLAKQAARQAGAFEAWQVADDDTVTEGASTNAWIVTQDGTLVTRPVENAILAGITRLRVLDLAREAGIPVELRAFTVAEAKTAREAFVSSTTAFVMPVTRIDDAVLGNGRAGAIALRLRSLYEGFMVEDTPKSLPFAA